MFNGNTVTNRPLAYCVPCSEKTPHRYERLGVDGRLTSRAICLLCNNDSREETAHQRATGIFKQPGSSTFVQRNVQRAMFGISS